MTEWVKEDNWGAVKVGDRFRVERANGDTAEATCTVAHSGYSVSSVTNFFSKSDGWTLYVPARPEPALPTEPGLYSDVDGDVWLLAPSEKWSMHIDGDFMERSKAIAVACAPFTRLEPVPVTAKKVLDRVREETRADHWWKERVDKVAAEFGVTTDD